MALFAKPSLSIPQMVAHLQAGGMVIPNVADAQAWLRKVGYYRLSAYWFSLKINAPAGPRFAPGTNFTTIVALYEFDRALRLHLLNAIERVEVAIRTSWASVHAQRGGPHGYLRASLYDERRIYHDNLSRLVREVGTSPETFIDHYRDHYEEPAMPPSWMVSEIMSLGQLSRWYSSLKDRSLRNLIAQPLNLPEVVLVPIIRHLSTVRNTCAHHGRLWNRRFLIRAKMPRKPAALVATLDQPVPNAAPLYNSLVLLAFLVLQVDPATNWVQELKALLLTHPTGDLGAMGFPANWQQRPYWI